MVVMLPEGCGYESDPALKKYFFDVITILYTSRLKALGSNPLNNSRRLGTTVCLCFCIYDYSMFRGFKPGAFKMENITIKKCIHMFPADSNQCPPELLSRMIQLSYTRHYTIDNYHHHLRGPPFSPKNKQQLFALASFSILLLCLKLTQESKNEVL